MKVKINSHLLKKELESDSFLNNHYGKTVAVFRNIIKETKALLTEEWLQADLSLGLSPLEWTRLIFHGFPVDMNKVVTNGRLDFEKLTRIHQGGATVIVNSVENRSDPIYYLSQLLEATFNSRTHCNLYITPRHAAGFKPHSDDHDVFAMQIKGSKKWSFYQHKDLSAAEIGKAQDLSNLSLSEEIELHKGDVLYVPRGLVHAAKGTDQDSWHLTFGLTGYYWQDALKDIIDQASFQIPALQRPLTINTDSKPQLDVQAEAFLERIKEFISVERGIESFQKKFPDLGLHLDQIKVPDNAESIEITAQTSFSLVSDAHLSFEVSEDGTSIMLPYRRFPLKLNQEASEAIAEMREREHFKAETLTSLRDENQRLLLLYYLWQNGIIESV